MEFVCYVFICRVLVCMISKNRVHLFDRVGQLFGRQLLKFQVFHTMFAKACGCAISKNEYHKAASVSFSDKEA